MEELVNLSFKNGCTHFLEMSGGSINPTEMVASLINQKSSIVEGIQYAQEMIDGSMTLFILTPKGIFAARDRLGRTPIIIGKKSDAYCASFESFAYLNLGYETERELGPGEIAFLTAESVHTDDSSKFILPKKQREVEICENWKLSFSNVG